MQLRPFIAFVGLFGLSIAWADAPVPPKIAKIDHDHGLWTSVLKDYQDEQGNVYYKKLKADTKKNSKHLFNQYLDQLRLVGMEDYKEFSDPQKMAFLINAYNAFTVKLIIDNYPVKSIKDTGGFFSSPWKKEFFRLLGGKIKSLDPIEHDWLRKKFKDARIHAAVNCASVSCPKLRNEAYTAKKLDAQLDEMMRVWLSDKTRNTVKDKELYLSKIFDWYGDDFVKAYGSVKNAVAKFGPQPLAKPAKNEKTDIEFLDYNWNLNEAK